VKPTHCQFTQLYFGTLCCKLTENIAYFILFIVKCGRSCWCHQSGNLRVRQVWGGRAGWKKPSPLFWIWTAIPSSATLCQSYIQHLEVNNSKVIESMLVNGDLILLTLHWPQLDTSLRRPIEPQSHLGHSDTLSLFHHCTIHQSSPQKASGVCYNAWECVK